MKATRKPSKSTHARTVLLRELAAAVADLVKRDDAVSLDEVLSGTGFLSNDNSHTSKDLGRAILLLAPLLERVDDLASVTYTAVYQSSRCDDIENVDARCALADHAANAALERAGRDVLERFLEEIHRPITASQFSTTAPAEVH